MMKKAIALLLTLIMLLGLVACGDRTESTKAPDTSAPETTAPETTAPETTAPETTKAPETTAPETTAAETTAAEPETTKATETTKAPETTKEPETTAAPNYNFLTGVWNGTSKTLIYFSTPDKGKGSVLYRENSWNYSETGTYTVADNALTVTLPVSSGKTYILTADVSLQKTFYLECTNGLTWTPESFTRIQDAPSFKLTASGSGFTLLPGKTAEVSYTLEGIPEYGQKMSFFAQDTSVATIDGSGKITAKAGGTTKVYASLGGQQVSWTVKVNPLADGKYKIDAINHRYEPGEKYNGSVVLQEKQIVILSEIYMKYNDETVSKNIGPVTLPVSSSCTVRYDGPSAEGKSYTVSYADYLKNTPSYWGKSVNTICFGYFEFKDGQVTHFELYGL